MVAVAAVAAAVRAAVVALQQAVVAVAVEGEVRGRWPREVMRSAVVTTERVPARRLEVAKRSQVVGMRRSWRRCPCHGLYHDLCRGAQAVIPEVQMAVDVAPAALEVAMAGRLALASCQS